ncbi:MAG: DUF2723 domain-containing protein [Bacteroidetes bacterium]|nr:MAG: DUF2723 domain-containing protein [Bacteroidota bacterium]
MSTNSFKRITNIAGWLVFAMAAVVYYFSAESTGSLWDCGEFILGAYKLQVVHPPGAPMFLLVGRLFTYLAELFTDTEAHPENIAFAVNLMSGLCTAFGAMFLAWITIIFGKLALVGREGETDNAQTLALAGAGIVAGLTMTFATSVWFSAVEGEVYAMSTFFTCLTLWAGAKWYALPDTPQSDRWIVLTVFSAALSMGVHLLSLLTFPALAMLYAYKKNISNKFLRGLGVVISVVAAPLIALVLASFIVEFGYQIEDFFTRVLVFAIVVGGLGYIAYDAYRSDNHFDMDKFMNAMGAAGIGVLIIGAIQKLVITGIPNLWERMELFMVNGLGMPFHSGIYPTILLVAGLLFFGFRYAHKKGSYGLQLTLVCATMTVIGFSTIGVVVIRANANTPINMNAPSDPMRLLPYLNREQYGERPLLFGPNFTQDPIDSEVEDRYGQVTKDENGNPVERYDFVDEKVSYIYGKKVFFPRMGDGSQGRPEKYRNWIDKPSGEPTFLDNVEFFFKYQLGWMYWRYFMWNFSGRQNGEQGYYSWDKKSGNWETGIKFYDEARLYDMDHLPETMKNDPARNHYYMIPLIFGFLGLWFMLKRNVNDTLVLLALFVITGIGIIIYSNQPPNEPRERDYVLVGSIFTFAIWVGMGVLALFDMLRQKIPAQSAAIAGSLLVLTAPVIMGSVNFDDHSRRHHTAARDYASNFLNSCEPNAIVFTYGDNDTYPLWYAQEVEGIRTDVRVVNLSLIAVDWYIDQLRRKVNDSPAIKMTIPREAYRGKKRNTTIYYNPSGKDKPMTAEQFLTFIGNDRNALQGQGGRTLYGYMPTRDVYIPVDVNKARAVGALTPADTAGVVDKIPIKLAGKNYLVKDELAVLDVIASNIWERPVYFAVTCRPDKMFGLDDYMQLEGLTLRIIPVKSESDRGLYVYGNGRVSVDHVYNNVMNKFRWGNFDKIKTYVDHSYGPSIQSHRVIIMRAAREAQRRGDKERAIALIQKYLEAFPHFNFPYDYNTWQMLKIMIDAGGYEQAKPHIEILAKETRDWLEFYVSLPPKELDRETGSFGQDFELAMGTQFAIKREVEKAKDEAFLKEIEEMFAEFDLSKLNLPQ